jgi:hypothetical protein
MSTIDSLKEVYGGPYSDEADLIIKENALAKEENREPNFDKLFVDRDSISSGAKQFILTLIHPSDPPVGPFVDNVGVDYEAEKANGVNLFPEIVDNEKVAGEEEAPGEEISEEEPPVDDESLEEIFGDEEK